jgi:hypothetical protein
MPYSTGESKSLDDITLEDVLKYPIWEWALDEEGEVGQDETWQRPIIDTDNLTDDIYNPTITFKIKDTDLFGSAEFDDDTQSLSAISIWLDNKWKVLSETQITTPTIFIAIPKIDGVQDVEFICNNLTSDNAERQ